MFPLAPRTHPWAHPWGHLWLIRPHWRAALGALRRLPQAAAGGTVPAAAAPAPRSGGGAAMTALEATWLLRRLLSCFGLTTLAPLGWPEAQDLQALQAALATLGLGLREQPAARPRTLQRGDVLRLAPGPRRRGPELGSDSALALVVDAGATWLRVHAVGAEFPVTCARSALRGLLGPSLLRIERIGRVPTQWDSTWPDLV